MRIQGDAAQAVEIEQVVTAAGCKRRKGGWDTVRDGDEVFYAWGEARRNGELEVLLQASSAMELGGGVGPRGAGTHSNPVLARILAADQHRLGIALAIDNEVRLWTKDKHQKLWADIAILVYASAIRCSNAEVARRLDVSLRTIEGCRSSMRRVILITARMAGFGRA